MHEIFSLIPMNSGTQANTGERETLSWSIGNNSFRRTGSFLTLQKMIIGCQTCSSIFYLPCCFTEVFSQFHAYVALPSHSGYEGKSLSCRISRNAGNTNTSTLSELINGYSNDCYGIFVWRTPNSELQLPQKIAVTSFGSRTCALKAVFYYNGTGSRTTVLCTLLFLSVWIIIQTEEFVVSEIWNITFLSDGLSTFLALKEKSLLTQCLLWNPIRLYISLECNIFHYSMPISQYWMIWNLFGITVKDITGAMTFKQAEVSSVLDP